MNTSTRFTLVPEQWYAAEFIGDEFGSNQEYRSYSPIRIHSVTPLKSGGRRLKVAFYHANYPEGVRDKTYTLETLERGEHYILCRSVEHSPTRLVLLYSISWEWMSRHFGVERPCLEEDLSRWLTANV
jgi:hypothetical protein